MFKTIGHTFSLMKMSWDVLMLDKELILFPIFSVIGIAAITLPMAPFLIEGQAEGPNLSIPVVIYLVLVYSVIVFFSGALVASALTRLRGGDPNVKSGLNHALRHIHYLILWAVIFTIVTILFELLRSTLRRIPFTHFIVDLLEGVWGFFTFFVVPVIVAENRDPISSIKRSISIVRSTWGRQITASFGFFIFYILALLAAAVPAVPLGLVYLPLGIGTFIVLGVFFVLVVLTLEDIFKAALYDYAVGTEPVGFDVPVLEKAFSPA